MARSTKTFGYTYPELQNNASVSSVKAAINKLYGSNTGGDNLLSKRFFDFDAPEPEPGLSERDAAAKNGPPKRREYIANIVSDKFSCNGSYAVYVFLGNFDSSDPKCWPTQPNLVGTHAVFSMIPQDIKDDAQKVKREAMSGIKVTGTIPLNSALLERFKAGEMRSRQPGSVEEYMTNNLQYRVAKVSLISSISPKMSKFINIPLTIPFQFDGTEILLTDVPNLSVSVVGADVTPATKDDQFPKWTNFQALRQVTDGIGARCT